MESYEGNVEMIVSDWRSGLLCFLWNPVTSYSYTAKTKVCIFMLRGDNYCGGGGGGGGDILAFSYRGQHPVFRTPEMWTPCVKDT